MATRILLTTSTCPPCKIIKQYIEDNQIQNVEIVDFGTPRGQEVATKYSAKSVPLLIVDDSIFSLIYSDVNSIKAELNRK